MNKAPFDKRLEPDFSENEIGVLSAVNDKGKTTILSYIADSFYEMAKVSFPLEFKGSNEGEFYRVCSPIYNLKQNVPSFVYLRYGIFNSTKHIDYLEVQNICTKGTYDNAINLQNKIPFEKLKEHFQYSNSALLHIRD